MKPHLTLIAWALAGVFCLFGAANAADAVRIDAFSGQWVGKVAVETLGPVDSGNTAREAGVAVTPDGKGGFLLEWSTVRHDASGLSEAGEEANDTKLTFAPTDKPGRWAATGTADPAHGKPAWFARLDGGVLTVSGFALLDNGKAELQTYQRTLEGDTLSLSYTRVVEGVVVRRATGVLTRFAK